MFSLKIVNKGFHYAQDGPGNRLVYHLYGCNLHCPWCANPETLFENSNTEQVFPEEILRQVISAKSILIDSGGVTFTGGEPTLQAGALIETLSLLRDNNIHTAIQTNGTSEEFSVLLPLLSLLMIDFKHYNNKKHNKVIGISNINIINNIRFAGDFGLPVWVRIPIIKGFNAADDDIAGFLEVCDTFNKNNISYEFLPYHEYGRSKWEKFGKEYTVSDGSVSPKVIKRFEDAFTSAGLRVIRT